MGYTQSLEPPMTPQYRVEIVLFENLQAAGRSEDPGPPLPPPEPIEDAYGDDPVSGEQDEGTEFKEDVDEAPMDSPPGTPVSGESVTLRYEPAEPEELTGIARALRRRSGYRVLAHEAWLQPGFPRGEGPTVDLETVGRIRSRETDTLPEQTEPSAWQANATLWTGRYLHLDLDAELEREARSVRLVESRRLRIGEMHYFDSPRLGAIAIVLRWEPIIADEALTDPPQAR